MIKFIRAYNYFFGWSLIFMGMCIGITFGLRIGGLFHDFEACLSLVLFFSLILAIFKEWNKELKKHFICQSCDGEVEEPDDVFTCGKCAEEISRAEEQIRRGETVEWRPSPLKYVGTFTAPVEYKGRLPIRKEIDE